MKRTYKEKSTYFETGSADQILSKGVRLFLVFLQNRNRYQINLVLM